MLVSKVGQENSQNSQSNSTVNAVAQSNGHSYSVTEQQNNQLQILFDQNAPLMQSPTISINGISFPIVTNEEKINEEFIENLNKSREEDEQKAYLEKAWKFINRLREREGLEISNNNNEKSNIADAREGLWLLTNISAAKCWDLKDCALESLIELLRKDPLTPRSSAGLIELAICLMNQLAPKEIQKENLYFQIKFATAFGLVIELILQQYNKGRGGGIEETLKQQLKTASKHFKQLNTQDDPALSFAIKFALEAIKKLQTDKNQLISFLKSLYKIIDGLGKLYKQDISGGISSFVKIFQDLEITDKDQSWFKYAFVINDLVKKAKENDETFNAFQEFYQQNKGQLFKLDWKFTYTYVQALGWLALSADTPEIRLKAYNCLELFNSCSEFRNHYTFLRSFQRFEKFKKIETNFVLQSCSVEWQIKLAKLARDPEICLKAIRSIHFYFINLMQSLQSQSSTDFSTTLKEKLLGKLSEIFPNQDSCNNNSLSEEQLYLKAIELNLKNSQVFKDLLPKQDPVPTIKNDVLSESTEIKPSQPKKEIEYYDLPADQVGLQAGLYVSVKCTNDSCEKSQNFEWMQYFGDSEDDNTHYELHDILSMECSACNQEVEIEKFALSECGCKMTIGKEDEMIIKHIGMRKGIATIVEPTIELEFLDFEMKK